MKVLILLISLTQITKEEVKLKLIALEKIMSDIDKSKRLFFTF